MGPFDFIDVRVSTEVGASSDANDASESVIGAAGVFSRAGRIFLVLGSFFLPVLKLFSFSGALDLVDTCEAASSGGLDGTSGPSSLGVMGC